MSERRKDVEHLRRVDQIRGAATDCLSGHAGELDVRGRAFDEIGLRDGFLASGRRMAGRRYPNCPRGMHEAH